MVEMKQKPPLNGLFCLILDGQKPFPQRKKKGKKRKKAGWSAGQGKSARLAHQSKNKNIEQVR